MREGEIRGLIGPRELPKLWERHILNSAAVPYAIEQFTETNCTKTATESQTAVTIAKTASAAETVSQTIVDVGSGAGFPGIVIAAMVPNSNVYLLDSMQRRTDWLKFAVAQIGLKNVTVVRGRAEEVCKSGDIPLCDFATARAVAPMHKLIPWTLPFLKKSGVLLALKGESVTEEITIPQYYRVARKFNLDAPQIIDFVPSLHLKNNDYSQPSTKVAVIKRIQVQSGVSNESQPQI